MFCLHRARLARFVPAIDNSHRVVGRHFQHLAASTCSGNRHTSLSRLAQRLSAVRRSSPAGTHCASRPCSAEDCAGGRRR